MWWGIYVADAKLRASLLSAAARATEATDPRPVRS